MQRKAIKLFMSVAALGLHRVSNDGISFDELYKYADKALDRAKENGRNGYAFYSEL